MPIKSQGTHLYFVDNLTTPATPTLVKMSCPASLSGVGSGAKDQIDVTCLDALTDREYLSGLASPSAISVPYNFDPKQVSHQLLNQMKADGGTTEFMICLSDGTDAPTLVGGVLTAPLATKRTSIKFVAYVAENTVEFATNEVVKGTVSLQRSGSETWVYKV